MDGEKAAGLALLRLHALHGAGHRGDEGDVEVWPAETEAGRAFDRQADEAVEPAVRREADKLALIDGDAPDKALGVYRRAVREAFEAVRRKRRRTRAGSRRRAGRES